VAISAQLATLEARIGFRLCERPLFQETQIAYCAPLHSLAGHVGALTREDVSHYDWVWPSHPLPEMPAPTSIERLTVLTDSMDGAALLILSGQHLGFLPQHLVSAFLNELIDIFSSP
jgi:DNA-binding transcriptional LysR family regulator